MTAITPSKPRQRGALARLGLRGAFGAILLHAAGAHAITFTGASAFAYSGSVTFLTPPVVVDTATGFTLRGDYQLGAGTEFLIASRRFDVGPLPERIDSAATEDFKIVLAGGGSGAPSAAGLWATVRYDLLPDPVGSSYPGFAIGSQLHVADSGLAYGDASLPHLLDGVLPTSRILAPGSYLLRTIIQLTYEPDPAAVYPMAALIELGGLSSFDGVNVSLVGTPVPEPAPLALLCAGGLALAWRLRSRTKQG